MEPTPGTTIPALVGLSNTTFYVIHVVIHCTIFLSEFYNLGRHARVLVGLFPGLIGLSNTTFLVVKVLYCTMLFMLSFIAPHHVLVKSWSCRGSVESLRDDTNSTDTYQISSL